MEHVKQAGQTDQASDRCAVDNNADDKDWAQILARQLAEWKRIEQERKERQ